MADQIGVPVQFESHRNCITNDLYSNLCLLGAIPEMRMCADLSHYVMDREFWFLMSDRDMGLITRICSAQTVFKVALRAVSTSSYNSIFHKIKNRRSGSKAGGMRASKTGVNAATAIAFFCELGST